MDREQFLTKVEPEPTTGCWLWMAGLDRHGYGFATWEGRSRLAHRVAYMLFTGPIPDGLTLDHLCRTPACVNPAHLEPVTTQVNTRRGIRATRDHCAKGHPYTPGSFYWFGPRKSWRLCKACQNERRRV